MSRFVELDVCTVGFDDEMPGDEYWVAGSIDLDEVVAIVGLPNSGECHGACRVLLSSGGAVYVKKSHAEFCKLLKASTDPVCEFPGWTDGCGKPFVGDVQEATVGAAVKKKPQFTEKQAEAIKRQLAIRKKLQDVVAMECDQVCMQFVDAHSRKTLYSVGDGYSIEFAADLYQALDTCFEKEIARIEAALPFEIQTKDDSNLDAEET